MSCWPSFLCCARGSSSSDEVDENSRLIPNTVDDDRPSPAAFDYARFEERLETIVRAKEGRMVNVAALSGPYPNAEGEYSSSSNYYGSRSSSQSRSIERPPPRTPSMALQAHILSMEGVQPVSAEQTRKAALAMNLNVGSLSRSWDD